MGFTGLMSVCSWLAFLPEAVGESPFPGIAQFPEAAGPSSYTVPASAPMVTSPALTLLPPLPSS